MAEIKWICLTFSLTQLLSLAVGTLNINEKWFNGPHLGYDGEFCLPGVCIGGGGNAHLHLGGAGRGDVQLGDDGFGGGGGMHLGVGGLDPYLGGGDEGGSYMGGRGGGGDDDDEPFRGGYGSGCDWSGTESNECSGGKGKGGERYRETMYCKPLACTSGSCSGLHVHLDKGLYKSLVSKNAAKLKEAEQSSSTDHMPETLNHNALDVAAMAPESN